MTIGELIGCIIVVVWLAGAGALAHVIPKLLEENDFTQMAMAMEPERVSVLMAICVVSWPITLPALLVMKMAKERQ